MPDQNAIREAARRVAMTGAPATDDEPLISFGRSIRFHPQAHRPDGNALRRHYPQAISNLTISKPSIDVLRQSECRAMKKPPGGCISGANQRCSAYAGVGCWPPSTP